jgi:mannose-6-phosphate isomerase-like protein (cupin superfamily)
MKEIKPWGEYIILAKDHGYQVKKITIKPGCRLSLQKHEHRSKFWTTVRGQGTVEIGYDKSPILHYETKPGIYHYIPCGAIHRITNNDKNSELIFIEAQTGTYLEEDDIIRFEDDYGRIKKT